MWIIEMVDILKYILFRMIDEKFGHEEDWNVYNLCLQLSHGDVRIASYGVQNFHWFILKHKTYENHFTPELKEEVNQWTKRQKSTLKIIITPSGGKMIATVFLQKIKTIKTMNKIWTACSRILFIRFSHIELFSISKNK